MVKMKHTYAWECESIDVTSRTADTSRQFIAGVKRYTVDGYHATKDDVIATLQEEDQTDEIQALISHVVKE